MCLVLYDAGLVVMVVRNRRLLQQLVQQRGHPDVVWIG